VSGGEDLISEIAGGGVLGMKVRIRHILLLGSKIIRDAEVESFGMMLNVLILLNHFNFLGSIARVVPSTNHPFPFTFYSFFFFQ
jgi:hypothetical protein